MKDQVMSRLSGWGRSFGDYTAGQKAVALVGTAALLMAGFMMFQWASRPDYAPLFSNLSAADASAVVEELDTQGIAYELTNGGATVMVPRNDVYKTRIQLSGQGIPSGSDGGYSLLDSQDISTSEFKEQTDFKRAMEGELAKTIGAMDGVQSAVVHLALPPKEVFADEQAPPTASILVSTSPGQTLDPQQVQSVVHLVAASIDGMSPDKVTVADSSGRLLSDGSGQGGGVGSNRAQTVNDFQDQVSGKIQTILDRVVGPGNSAVQVTADLDFDKAQINSRTYRAADPDKILALSENIDKEKYVGADGTAVPNGVVGPDGQMDTTTTTGADGSTYDKSSTTRDNAVDTTVERRDTAPGSLKSIHIGVALDRTAAANTDPDEIQSMIESAVGITPKRGDSVRVSVLPFDRTAEQAAAKDLAAQTKAEAASSRNALIRNGGIAGLLLLAGLLAWLRARRRRKQRQDATEYVVEQLRTDALQREQERELTAPNNRVLSLGAPPSGSANREDDMREELVELIERQPEDVAALLRGWLVESR